MQHAAITAVVFAGMCIYNVHSSSFFFPFLCFLFGFFLVSFKKSGIDKSDRMVDDTSVS